MSVWGKIKQAGRWVDKNVTQPGLRNPVIGGVPGIFLGRQIDKADAERRKKSADKSAAAESARWDAEYGDWRDRWNNVNALEDAAGNRTRTGERYDDLAGLYTGEVDRGMYDAGSRVADNYARRGMSDSGYAAASQGDVISQAAAARAAAREAAMKEAIGEGMQIGMGELAGMAPQSALAMEPYRAAREWAMMQLQQQQAQQAKDQDEYLKLVSSIGGKAAGSYLGG